MRSDRTWKFESVIMLAAGLMISLSAVGLIMILLERTWSEIPSNQKTFLQFVLNTMGFHGASFLLLHLFLRQHDLNWREFLGITRHQTWRPLAWGALTGLAVLPLALGLNWLSGLLITHLHGEPVEQQSVLILRDTQGPGELVAFGVAAIILAPLVEEMLFRGVLYRFLKQYLPTAGATLLSATLFALIHVNLMTFLPLVVLGIVLARTYERSGCLLAPVATHAIFNSVNFAMLVTNFDPFQQLGP